MASFAKLGVGNKILTVESVDDNIATTEQAGVEFLQNLYKDRAVWKQTFIDGSQRKNYAGIGFTYDQTRNAFIPPNSLNSWTLNEETCLWEAPVAKPDDGQIYNWNEETTSWDLVDNS
tara:strand:- start:22 stop:375 length:354 start_codon:yes stop_codon:yes gene_type:complete